MSAETNPRVLWEFTDAVLGAMRVVEGYMGLRMVGSGRDRRVTDLALVRSLLAERDRLERELGGGWVPVSERLPEAGGDEAFNVILDSGDRLTARMAGFGEWEGVETEAAVGELFLGAKVTHWRPLPAGPEPVRVGSSREER